LILSAKLTPRNILNKRSQRSQRATIVDNHPVNPVSENELVKIYEKIQFGVQTTYTGNISGGGAGSFPTSSVLSANNMHFVVIKMGRRKGARSRTGGGSGASRTILR
jgi:hypothetical protein